MTVREFIDSLPAPMAMKVMAVMMLHRDLDKSLALRIDREAGRVQVVLDGKSVLDTTFAEIEAKAGENRPDPQGAGKRPAGRPGLAG